MGDSDEVKKAKEICEDIISEIATILFEHLP